MTHSPKLIPSGSTGDDNEPVQSLRFDFRFAVEPLVTDQLVPPSVGPTFFGDQMKMEGPASWVSGRWQGVVWACQPAEHCRCCLTMRVDCRTCPQQAWLMSAGLLAKQPSLGQRDQS